MVGLEAATFQRGGRLEARQLEVVLVPVFEGVNSERAVMTAAEQARTMGKELLLMVVVEVPKSLPEGFTEYAKIEWRGEEPRWLYARLKGEEIVRSLEDLLRESGVRYDYVIETYDSFRYAIGDGGICRTCRAVLQIPTKAAPKRARKAFSEALKALEELRVPITLVP
ncbi:MAG: hypothetical protein QXP43_02405 [Nitrososphaerota archaeon]|nr:hypothetical protein [Candidatus Calditenuis fumarioli]